MLENRCWTRKLRDPTFQSATPSSSSGSSSASTEDRPEHLARARDVVRDLAVDDARLGVVQQSFGELALAAAGGAGRGEIGEPVHDDDVLDAVATRELERGLQPLADAEDRERAPRLVEDVDDLRRRPCPRGRRRRAASPPSRAATPTRTSSRVRAPRSRSNARGRARRRDRRAAVRASSAPSNMPRRSPSQSRCSASATGRMRSASSSARGHQALGHRFGRREQQRRPGRAGSARRARALSSRSASRSAASSSGSRRRSSAPPASARSRFS